MTAKAAITLREHLIDGEFQSDKYPTTPRGKVPLSCKDKAAQPHLWLYAQDRRPIDASFDDDLREALRLQGYEPLSALDAINAIILRRIDVLFKISPAPDTPEFIELDALTNACMALEASVMGRAKPALARQAAAPPLCEDCPPVGYPTDKTRCDPCPRTAAVPRGRILLDEADLEEYLGEDKYRELKERQAAAPTGVQALVQKWRDIAAALTPDAAGLEPTSAAAIRVCKRVHEEHAAELEAALKQEGGK